ncbi:MAG: phosphate/phosphite/phosphonate ABC transporter substrate-binding protein [Bdellovibrionaceae bacterium]|nr:phosphate/phosphite/phosphonate ABC transporter substrate-binding protein [Pseudobdellovibrionaceae bacterium]
MNKLAFCLIFILSLSGLASSKTGVGASEAIRIGFTPGGDPEKLRSQAIELGTLLQQQIGRPVEIVISKDYFGLAEAMKSGRVDFAFFTAASFVQHGESSGARVLLKKVYNDEFYYSAIIVPRKSSLRSLSGLKGKRIAFVDRNSGSGWLYPSVKLRQSGLDPEKDVISVFAGNHAAAVKMLESGGVDAAAVFSDDEKGNSGAWAKFAAKLPVRVLWVSDPIPSDPFCVHQAFYEKDPKLTHDVMFSLIEIMDDHADSKKFEEVLGLKRLRPATARQYDPVREMIKLQGQ